MMTLIVAMLKNQLSIRGVQQGDVDSRVATVIEKLGADKLRTHLKDPQDKQLAAIKNLANLAKTRLIAPQELAQFQKEENIQRNVWVRH